MKRPALVYALLLILITGCSSRDNALFTALPSSHTGIHFNNSILDNDSFNVLDVENIYNGGGAGIGDFNNDGLQDVYFTGNTVSCKLYLNKGDFVFKDVTETASVTGNGRFCRGVTVVDINNDGLLDIYVSATLSKDAAKRENLLYINTGIDKEGVPHFSNQAREYGLADTSHSTMAAFFDYDNDGDLDMYLLINEIKKDQYPNLFRAILSNSENPNTDKLFRNDWNQQLQHPVYTDISREAGITIEGYGHAVTICDLNNDGWKDIYVTNDFLANNTLYINQHNGHFKDEVRSYFKHTAANAMGQDVVDINNDGLPDIIELDMNPQDNYRKKMMMTPNSYQVYMNMANFGYQYQYVHNTVQLNQGPRVLQNDSVGAPLFSDIGYFSGIAETDWSWTPLVTDFDNNGYRDIIITNGFPKDVTDHDFITYRTKAYAIAGKKEILSQVPEVKISNYGYRNNGDGSFADVSKEWGITTPSFSNGAAYADFDKDGDMDFVVNNINDEAFVYRNEKRQLLPDSSHFLQILFAGDTLNRNGLGATAAIHYNHGSTQVWDNTPYRGYLSSIQNMAHFGLGTVKTIDSLVVTWPNGKKQVIQNVAADQKLVVRISNAENSLLQLPSQWATNSLFREVTDATGIRFVHDEKDFVDFNIQKLIPHKLSEYGPALAAGDINNDGIDDFVTGGAFNYSAQIFIQQKDGRFRQAPLLPDQQLETKLAEDTGVLLFDADGDGDLDLYIASGGYENAPGSSAYQDRLYANDGKGHFTYDSLAIPTQLESKFCVRSIDYDKDGDLDLFVAGRVTPWSYPKPTSSFIYRNDSENGHLKFTDVTATVAKGLQNIGLVCDAVFTDFDNDGWTDLLLAGEWMPITFFKNDKGVFRDVTALTGVAAQSGWWNSIAPGDFDNDGDIDYIVGNLGCNSQYRATDQYPVFIYAKDFDNNGSYDAFPAQYFAASQQDQTLKLFPAQTREDVIKQMIGLRSKFQNYTFYASATIEELFSKEQLIGALKLTANNFNSSYLSNQGNGKFTLTALPAAAQISVLNGMIADDFDGDHNLDVLISGNDYGTEVSVGRYDALNGLLLKGNGKGGFSPQTMLQSGICIAGNGKSLVKLRGATGAYLVAAAQNRGPLKMFTLKKQPTQYLLQPGDERALITFNDGRKQLQEFYYGASFLSQSARFMQTDSGVSTITVYDSKGKATKIK